MATLTSTANCNLTSTTGWSPAQIPAAGDDLILNGAHILTLDADFSGANALRSVSFNNAGARIAISGTTRHVAVTNGWLFPSVNINGRLCNTTLTTGMNVTLTGTWVGSIWNMHLDGIFTSTGGNATLQTFGANPSAVLFSTPVAGIVRAITSTWSGGTLTTIGRIVLSDGHNQNTQIVTMTAGTWNHSSTGLNHIGALTTSTFSISGTAQINWTGSIECNSSLSGGVFSLSSNATHSISGGSYLQKNSTGFNTNLFQLSNGTLNVTGYSAARNGASVFSLSGGTINYVNQTYSQTSGDYFVIRTSGGTLNLSGINFTFNQGAFLSVSPLTSVVVDANTVFSCPATALFGAYFSTALEAKAIRTPNPAPTLPAVNNVTKDVVYGYAASPLTGTGLIVDPAILAAAVQAGVGLASPNLDTQLAGIIVDIANIEVDNVAIGEAARDATLGASLVDYTSTGTVGAALNYLVTTVAAILVGVTQLTSRITSTLFSGITRLSHWLGAIAGKTADTTTRTEINATTAGASYNETTDSQEAIRDRGDAAWTTGAASTIYVLPTKGTQQDRRASTDEIRIYRTEGYTLVRTVTDAAGANVDLSTKTLEMIIEGENRNDKAVIPDADISVSGTGNATYTVEIPTTVSAKADKTYSFYLWDKTTSARPKLLDQGKFIITYAGTSGTT